MHQPSPSRASVMAYVERAKEELVAAVPSPRGVPRRSLAEALMRFEEGLRAAVEEMAGWRDGGGEAWRACKEALTDSLNRAERLRLEAPALDYEGLVGVLGELIDPLDVFADS